MPEENWSPEAVSRLMLVLIFWINGPFRKNVGREGFGRKLDREEKLAEAGRTTTATCKQIRTEATMFDCCRINLLENCTLGKRW